MVIAESVSRLAATLIAILQTRVQLVATEIEEESLRYFSYLIFSLAAMFCFGVAILLGVMLTVMLFWDTYRVAALSVLMVLFGIVGVALGRWVREQYRLKPALLGHSLTELSRDTELLKPPL
jgi:uncharacterized membrane protein YqjE